MFCPQCGTQNDGDARFCQNCGAALVVAKLAPKRRAWPKVVLVIVSSCVGLLIANASYSFLKGQTGLLSRLFRFAQDGGGRSPLKKLSEFAIGPEAELRSKLQNRFTKCGDSHYISMQQGSERTWGQYRDLDIQVFASGISKAEALNGFQWQGSYRIGYDAARFWSEDKGWGQWQSKSFTGEMLGEAAERVYVKKINGQWQGMRAANAPTIACSDIPPENVEWEELKRKALQEKANAREREISDARREEIQLTHGPGTYYLGLVTSDDAIDVVCIESSCTIQSYAYDCINNYSLGHYRRRNAEVGDLNKPGTGGYVFNDKSLRSVRIDMRRRPCAYDPSGLELWVTINGGPDARATATIHVFNNEIRRIAKP